MTPEPTPTPRADQWLRDYDPNACTLDAHATMQELERELAAAKEENQWQLIETAPVDRTTVLLYRDGNTFTGYYGGGNSGWRYNVRQFDSIWPLPTHWMPLPKPPTL